MGGGCGAQDSCHCNFTHIIMERMQVANCVAQLASKFACTGNLIHVGMHVSAYKSRIV